MATLEWKKLLCTKRERESKSGSSINPVRNEFEADYDRIVGSSSVRRLQDKAQVFPLQQNDVARTRLTHSMEVSALARSLGKAVGRRLEEKEIFQDREQTEKLSALLQVAGLIHDLGNPPFGHYGETVIRDWFGKWFSGEAMLSEERNSLSEQQKNDFIYFDGNVQNLRIVTKLQVQNDNKGANFTYGTLATIMKYPWSSESRPKGKIKFGYFESEQELAEAVRREIGLEAGVRHPATYLLEAADDIIYICDDIEDGTKKGYIEWEKEFETLYQKAEKGSYGEEIEKLLINVKRKNENVDSRMHDKEQVIAYVRNFRNMVQSFLFKKVVDVQIPNFGRFPMYVGKEYLRGFVDGCSDTISYEMYCEAKKVFSEFWDILDTVYEIPMLFVRSGLPIPVDTERYTKNIDSVEQAKWLIGKMWFDIDNQSNMDW